MNNSCLKMIVVVTNKPKYVRLSQVWLRSMHYKATREIMAWIFESMDFRAPKSHDIVVVSLSSKLLKKIRVFFYFFCVCVFDIHTISKILGNCLESFCRQTLHLMRLRGSISEHSKKSNRKTSLWRTVGDTINSFSKTNQIYGVLSKYLVLLKNLGFNRRCQCNCIEF